MDNIDPEYEFDCPNFVSFTDDCEDAHTSSYFDVDHQTGKRVSKMFLNPLETELEPALSDENILVGDEASDDNSDKNRKMSRSKRKSNRLYELRPTPSRVKRLSVLSPKDPAFFRLSIMLTPNVLRSQATPSSHQHSRKSLFSNSGITPLKRILYESHTTPQSKFLKVEKFDIVERDNIENFNPNKVKEVRFAIEEERLSDTVFVRKMPPTPYSSSSRSESRVYRSNVRVPGKSTVRCLSSSSVSRNLYTPSQKLQNSSKKSATTAKWITPARQMSLKRILTTPAQISSVRRSAKKHTISEESYFEVNHALVSAHKSSGNDVKTTALKPFHFETDKRIKNHEQGPGMKEVDFKGTLRHNTPKTKVPCATKLQPFSFAQTTTESKRAVNSEKSMAEKIVQFSKTPDRFRSKAANTVFQPKEATNTELTKPQSPKLLTVTRGRPIRVVSQAELDEQDIAEMKSYEFHAQPLNKKIFDIPNIAKPEVKKSTKPVDVCLNTENRAAAHKKPEQKEQYHFHAQEIPKNLFKGPTGLNKKCPLPVTEPKSPAFALKQRCQERRNSNAYSSQELGSSTCIKANPVPDFRSPFTVKKTTKVTTVQPFSFEDHDKERYARKAKRIYEEIENDKKLASSFHAQPLPPTPAPNRKIKVAKKQLTEPMPFHFASSEKASQSKTKEETPRVMQFKAQPASVIKKKPFIPKKQNRSVLVAPKLCLNTEDRATKRMKLKELQETQEAENERLKHEQQKEQMLKDKLELQQRRQDLVHKANPLPQFKQISIKPSSKPLTVPISPKFSKRSSRSE